MVLYAYAQDKEGKLEKFKADHPVYSAEDIAWLFSLVESSCHTKPERILISVQ